MRTDHYPSDITDAQWALIEPHIPAEPGGGRPRKTDMRDVLDAVLYIVRTGCQWRYLPVDFPPKSTVWRYFDQWRRDGTLDRIHDLLRRKVARRRSPTIPAPPRVSTASRSTPPPGASSGGGTTPRTLTAGNAISSSIAWGCCWPSWSRPPRLTTQRRPRRCSPGSTASRWARSCGCTPISKYHNFQLYEWVQENAAWDLSIVRRPEGQRGWVKLPIRWTVERTFGWLGNCRRLSKDREKSVLSSESFIKLAMIQLMFHRLRPSHTEPEFHYRSAG